MNIIEAVVILNRELDTLQYHRASRLLRFPSKQYQLRRSTALTPIILHSHHQTPFHPSPSLQVAQQIPQPRPRLHSTGRNLVRRQHKPILARVPQLTRETVLRFRHIRYIIDTGSRDLVDSGADGAGFEHGAVDRFDGGRDPLGEGLVFGVVGREDRAGVAVRWWEKEGY